jgi:signal transduction histidine kinase/ActR/RegA family two-component response regulator
VQAINWLLKNRTTIGFGLALAALGMVGGGACINLLSYKEASDRVQHTLNVQNTLETVLSTLKDAEVAQRGYLLTGKEQYLEPYNDALRLINPSLQSLQQLTLDNANQQRRLKALEGLVPDKLVELKQTIATRQTVGEAAALKIVQTDRGKHLMDAIRQQIAAMKNEENRILERRTAATQKKAQTTAILLISSSLLAFVLVALSAITVHRDIAKRRQVEEQLRLINEDLEQRVHDRTQALEQTNRLKDEFLSILSHELRNPLNAMLGWAKLLRAGKLSDDKVEQGLEVIERNARSQAQLIEDLLDISRIITGKLRLSVRPVSPVAIIEAAIDTMRPAADARSIRLQVTLDSEVGTISGDPDRLQQVVWNLLSNAIKFTPKGGKVQVRLERINSHIELTVSDTGQGISPEFLPCIFDRFSQADGSSTRSHSGLGLGLAIARNIVELHGGTIHVASPGEGQGSSFAVILPLMIIHQSAQSTEKIHPAARSDVAINHAPVLQGIRILVVDDEADARSLLTTILEQCGAMVTAAAAVSEALTQMETWQPDVLISDIGMPEEDGYVLIRQVRSLSQAQGGQTPAIALTAYARTEDRIRALNDGFQAHLAKPVEPAELVAIVKRFANLKES